MSQKFRRASAIALLTIVALVASTVGTAAGQTTGGDNAAIAVNTKDGSTLFRLAFSVRQLAANEVSPSNAAIAYASCDSCQTVAVAIQVVLVLGEADTVAPTNMAIAINDGCSACQTAALATQFVLGVDPGDRLTGPQISELQHLRQRFKELSKSNLAFEDLITQLNQLTTDLGAVLQRDIANPSQPALDAPTTTSTTSPDDSSGTTADSTTTSTTTSPGATSTTTTDDPASTTSTTSVTSTTTTTP